MLRGVLTRLTPSQQQYLPESKIFDGYRPGVMAEIQKNQANLVTWMQNHPEEAKGINPYFFIVMDGMSVMFLFICAR